MEAECADGLVRVEGTFTCLCPDGTNPERDPDSGAFLRYDAASGRSGFVCERIDGGVLDAGAEPADASEADACAAGDRLCGGSCVDTSSDTANCGGCGTACATGETCNAGECFDPVVQIDAGLDETCVVRASGAVWCWGANATGQLGDGTLTDRAAPVRVVGVGPADQVSVRGVFGDVGGTTCVVERSGVVQCWGRNTSGQVGDGTMSARRTPVRVTDLEDGVSVDVGRDHACAVRVGGRVVCWGDNLLGQIGVAGIGDRALVPTPVSGVIPVQTQLALFAFGSCSRRDDGTVRCWGAGMTGALGSGDTPAQAAPRPVMSIMDAVEVSAGDAFACARSVAGAVSCWGQGNLLGVGATTADAIATPTALTISPLQSIASGPLTSCCQGARS